MLKQRLISGTILALVAVGVLYIDGFFKPYFPILLVAMLVMAFLATTELVSMFPPATRPSRWFTMALVMIMLASNWYQPIATVLNWPRFASEWSAPIICLFGSFFAAIFREMSIYREPGGHVERIALTMFAVIYLAGFGSLFAQLRWLLIDHGVLLMSLTIFVTKIGDTGAYTAGRLFGKHKMTPILSPKKTWEGFAGGLIGSLLVVAILYYWAPFRFGVIEAITFGIVMSITGILGDLAESLIKRDAGVKDAAQSIPGFGGLLDVVDAVLFAAPVSYVWFFVTHFAGRS